MDDKEKKLIINADDFGYTPGVTYGIIEAFRDGIVTSTTALTVSDYFHEAMKLAEVLAPSLAIGVHLTLTLRGSQPLLPIEEVPSLVDKHGYFWNQNEFTQKVDMNEVYQEWDAQINRFFSSGKRPDHIDSHHNVHGANEEILEVALSLAQKYQLPLRNACRSAETVHYPSLYGEVKTTDKMISSFYGSGSTLENLIGILDFVAVSEDHSFEFNAHPALIDKQLQSLSSYCSERIEELAILTSSEAKQAVKERGIILTNYGIFN